MALKKEYFSTETLQNTPQNPHTSKTSISILGCGWLGFPLAKKLIDHGFSIKGSTTSKNKIEFLKSNKINPFLIKLSEEKPVGNITSFLESSETLIIDIPPGLRNNPAADFVKKIKNLLPFVEKSEIKNLLFISSTSVYDNAENFPEITENSPLNTSSESGKQLIAIEKLLQENVHFNTTILRFGGLIGGERHPINFLAVKTSIKNPKAPINLIGREDCLEIIVQIITQDYWQETLNAVHPDHPTKKEYYTRIAKNKNLEIPVFDDTAPSYGKIVLSGKLERIFGFSFRSPL